MEKEEVKMGSFSLEDYERMAERLWDINKIANYEDSYDEWNNFRDEAMVIVNRECNEESPWLLDKEFTLRTDMPEPSELLVLLQIACILSITRPENRVPTESISDEDRERMTQMANNILDWICNVDFRIQGFSAIMSLMHWNEDNPHKITFDNSPLDPNLNYKEGIHFITVKNDDVLKWFVTSDEQRLEWDDFEDGIEIRWNDLKLLGHPVDPDIRLWMFNSERRFGQLLVSYPIPGWTQTRDKDHPNHVPIYHIWSTEEDVFNGLLNALRVSVVGMKTFVDKSAKSSNFLKPRKGGDALEMSSLCVIEILREFTQTDALIAPKFVSEADLNSMATTVNHVLNWICTHDFRTEGFVTLLKMMRASEDRGKEGMMYFYPTTAPCIADPNTPWIIVIGNEEALENLDKEGAIECKWSELKGGRDLIGETFHKKEPRIWHIPNDEFKYLFVSEPYSPELRSLEMNAKIPIYQMYFDDIENRLPKAKRLGLKVIEGGNK